MQERMIWQFKQIQANPKIASEHLIRVYKMSCDMRFPTMWYVRPAKP